MIETANRHGNAHALFAALVGAYQLTTSAGPETPS